MATYTQADGTEDTTYFQDVAITPATVKDGTLRDRFSTKRYPKLGTFNAVAPVITAVSPASVAHGTSATLTITGFHFESGSVVTTSGAGITVTSVTNADHKGKTLTVAITVTSGAATGARSVTVTNPDTGAVTAAGALTIT